MPLPRLSMPACCSVSPSAIELACYLAARKDTFLPKTFYACLAATTSCVFLLPLFFTGTASFGAAREECYTKALTRNTARFLDVDDPDYDPDWNEAENFADNAYWHLFPTHFYNCSATAVSLFGVGVWLFFSPHNSDVAQDLDRTLGSYVALQWLGNILYAVLSLASTCNSSTTVGTIGHLVEILAMFGLSFGLSIIGTNLLCHRYLCEKARVMTKLYDRHTLNICLRNLRLDDANDPSIKWLKTLEASFVWEARSLCLFAVATPFWFIYRPVALAIGTFGILVILVMDTAFSVLVTAIFLRPIFKVLREGRAVAQHSAGYTSMVKTKWMTLLGASLAVLSSTALYINTVLWFKLGGFGTPFWANPYLNIFVFGVNLDSVLNDVGMLLVSGVLKKVDGSSLMKGISTLRSARRYRVTVEPDPRPPPVFDSRAYD